MTNIYLNGQQVELLKVDTADGVTFTYRLVGDGPEVERVLTLEALQDSMPEAPEEVTESD